MNKRGRKRGRYGIQINPRTVDSQIDLRHSKKEMVVAAAYHLDLTLTLTIYLALSRITVKQIYKYFLFFPVSFQKLLFCCIVLLATKNQMYIEIR